MLAAAAVDQKQKGGDRESCRTGSEYMMGAPRQTRRHFGHDVSPCSNLLAHFDLGTKVHFDLVTKLACDVTSFNFISLGCKSSR
jgi:hypothetical protein